MGMRRIRNHPAPPLIGNLIIEFLIVFPVNLTETQKEKIKEIL